MRFVICLFLSAGILFSAAAESVVDYARVTVEKRHGGDWSVLDSQVTGTVAVPLERVLAVVLDYEAYPRLFPKVRKVRVDRKPGIVLLYEEVVVEALGVINTNRFTLRLEPPVSRDGLVRLTWSQEETDGTIEGLEGGWIFRDVGAPGKPSVRVTYWTKSAVPHRVLGQDVVIGMFLGGETKAVVESVFKEALAR